MIRTTEQKCCLANKAMQTLEGELMWKPVKGFQIRPSSNKVQITRETRLLRSKDETETVLLMLFTEGTNI